jgi:salicylate hydroxylase
VLVPLQEVRDPQCVEWMRDPRIHIWLGPGAHLAAYTINQGQLLNLVFVVDDALPEDTSRATATVDDMMQLLEGWDPILFGFLEAAPRVQCWRLSSCRSMMIRLKGTQD